jgi:flagellar FliL protein
MSAAAPEVAAEAAPKKSNKKLIMMVAAALVLCGAGAGAYLFLKPKAGAEDEAHGVAAKPSAAPTYVPLDPFVVNLADKEADRFAQIGITLQVDDSKVADQMKTYMPAIRNGILMILAHKSSDELLERSGKEQLAGEIVVSVARALGIPVVDASAHGSPKVAPAKNAAKPVKPAKDDAEEEANADDAEAEAEAEAEGDEEPDPKAKKKKANEPKPVHNPVTQVHFSNFIIQ